MSFNEACRCCLNTTGMESATSIAALYENGTIMDLIKSLTNIEVILFFIIFLISWAQKEIISLDQIG